jgi:hypothetical protein
MARAKRIVESSEPKQLEIVKLPKNQINQQISDEVAEIKLLKHRRQSLLGDAKKLLNDIKKKLDNIENLAAQTCSPRIKENLDALLAELVEEGEDDPEMTEAQAEPRRAPHAEDWSDDE